MTKKKVKVVAPSTTCNIEACNKDVHRQVRTIAGTFGTCRDHSFWDVCRERGWGP